MSSRTVLVGHNVRGRRVAYRDASITWPKWLKHRPSDGRSSRDVNGRNTDAR